MQKNRKSPAIRGAESVAPGNHYIQEADRFAQEPEGEEEQAL
jgi:hypothetical protein